MKIVPVLYIQNGKVVSLYKGHDNAEKKHYSKAPHSYAAQFNKQGAKQLFVVDIDGNQEERLNQIREHFDGDIWWAGQIRDMESIHDRFERGANIIVLGDSAKSIHEEALTKYGPEKIYLGMQFHHTNKAVEACENLSGSSVGSIVMKDLNAEGTLFQPNFDIMEKCIYFSDKKVFASGGIANEKDIRILNKAGVSGVLIARAFYEHDLDLSYLVQKFETE